MKIRKNREIVLHFSSIKKMIIVGKKDPVLDYETVKQIRNTATKLVVLPDGHMSYIENRKELIENIMYFIEKM